MVGSPIDFAVFAFEGLLPELDSPPIAARRAFDHAGVRVPIEGWRSLAYDDRRTIAIAGAPDRVDTELVLALITRANPPPHRSNPVADPDPSAPPEALCRALEPARDLSAPRWARLRALDRYALAHTYRRAVARSSYSMLGEAFDAVIAASAQYAYAAPQPSPAPQPRFGPTPRFEAAPAPVAAVIAEPRHVAPAPLDASSSISTHVQPSGEVHMVDIAPKAETQRRAVVGASVRMRAETLQRIARHDAPKGEVIATARIAGIMAAKRTPELIPLCHTVSLTRVGVDIEIDLPGSRVLVTATAEALDRTGVEMEAMVAATVTCLTIYDMLKGIDREMVISEVKLLEKTGGKSGRFERDDRSP